MPENGASLRLVQRRFAPQVLASVVVVLSAGGGCGVWAPKEELVGLLRLLDEPGPA